jgi:hypothetical protein
MKRRQGERRGVGMVAAGGRGGEGSPVYPLMRKRELALRLEIAFAAISTWRARLTAVIYIRSIRSIPSICKCRR